MGPYLAIITGLLSFPFTLLISAEIGRAALNGQAAHLLSPLVSSTYLLVVMAKVEFGDHQRYTPVRSITAALVMLVAALVLDVIPFGQSIRRKRDQARRLGACTCRST